MIGDSLAEEPNSPQAKESPESNSPQLSVEESNSPETQEILASNSPVFSSEDRNIIAVQKILEDSPAIAQADPNIAIAKEILESNSPAIPQADPNIAAGLETLELNSFLISEEERNQPQAQHTLELNSLVVSEEKVNQPEAQEILEDSPVISQQEPNIAPAQHTLELNSSIPEEEGNQPEAQEILESNSPVLFVEQLDIVEIIVEIEELLESNTDSPSEAEVNIPAAQNTLESNLPPESYPSAPLLTPDSLPSPRTPQPLSPANPPKRIFVTGASGCIGHYIAERLIQDTEHELYLLVRDPAKVRFDCNARPGITIIRGDMRNIARFGKLLKTMDCAVLAATSWGGQQEVLDVNIYKTMQLLNLLDQELCQQVIYFSTASVLDRNNKILKEASQLGTDYIRSKSDFLTQVSRLPIYKRMTILFPTLVLGGDGQHPYSHLSSGLPGVTKWIKLIRFFKADASFHFIHGLDIAKVVGYLVDHPPSTKQPQQLVLGNPAVTLNQVVEEACAYLNQPILFRVPLYPWLANILIRVFNIQMAAWDRFCVEYRHFTYQNPVNPATFGEPVYCATFSEVLKSSGIPRGGETVQLENNYRLELDDQESRSEKET